jgi:hypothetical protein
MLCVVKGNGFQGKFHGVKRLSELPGLLDALDRE